MFRVDFFKNPYFQIFRKKSRIFPQNSQKMTLFATIKNFQPKKKLKILKKWQKKLHKAITPFL